MAAPKLKYAIGNSASTTLASSVSDSATSATLTSSTNFQAKSGAGMVILDEGQSTEELAYSTGLAGSDITIPLANRGLEGGSPQAHSSTATVKGIFSALMWNDMIDSLTNAFVASSGALDTTKVVDLTTAQTLTNKTITSPKVGTAINDTNGNEIIKTPATASAVNEITVTNAATGNGPTVSATGGDTDIDLNLVSKGAGVIKINGVAYSAASSDGWTAASDTWTYASASTFTIAGVDRTAIFTKGTRLKFTQTTVKYAVVLSSSFSTNTTVTIAVNTDYTITNAAISANYYSYQDNPQGYPTAFNFTLSYTSGGGAFTNNPTTNGARYAISGAVLSYFIDYSYNATSGGSGTTNITGFPVNPTSINYFGGAENITDSRINAAQISTSGTLIVNSYDGTSAIANSKRIAVTGMYNF